MPIAPFHKLADRIVAKWSQRISGSLTAAALGPKLIRICGATLDLRDYDRVIAVWCGRHPWDGFADQVEAVFGRENIAVYETATSSQVEQLAEVLRGLGEDDAVVFLHAGSVFCRPDVLQALSALRHAGAMRVEQEAVRKHLDDLSAPGLASLAQPADCLELCWSLSGIGCPCSNDPTVARDAREILDFYKIPEMTGTPLFRLGQRNTEYARRFACIDQGDVVNIFKDAVEELGLAVHGGQLHAIPAAGDFPAYCSFAFLEDRSRLVTALSLNPTRTHFMAIWNEPPGYLRYVAVPAGQTISAEMGFLTQNQDVWQSPIGISEGPSPVHEQFAILASFF